MTTGREIGVSAGDEGDPKAHYISAAEAVLLKCNFTLPKFSAILASIFECRSIIMKQEYLPPLLETVASIVSGIVCQSVTSDTEPFEEDRLSW